MTQRLVKEVLNDICHSSNPQQTAKTHAYSGPTKDELQVLEGSPVSHYRGKVREVIKHNSQLYMVHTDRLSAFDKLIDNVPYKGVILAAISNYWFEYIDNKLPHHSLGLPHERVLKTEQLEPVKVEVIVRNFLAGSMMRAYEEGVREFCGEKLPDGLKPYGRLPKPIITPTTKAEVFEHDENTTAEELIKNKICTREEWQTITNIALELFALGQKRYLEIGWLLVDTKYEFGRTPTGEIKIIDEIHTPDSSRLWNAATYESNIKANKLPDMFDKEIVRRWLIDHGFKGEGVPPTVPTKILIELAQRYLKIAEDLKGKPLKTEGPSQSVFTSFLN